jgi:dihydroorotate dehydrogenase
MGLNSKGVAWPSVGRQQRTTYGGISGNAVKPMALKAVSAIAKVRNQQEISGKKSMGFLTISPYTD